MIWYCSHQPKTLLIALQSVSFRMSLRKTKNQFPHSWPMCTTRFTCVTRSKVAILYVVSLYSTVSSYLTCARTNHRWTRWI